MKKAKLLFLAILPLLQITCTNKVKSGFDVIHQMKSKYNNSWYKAFTFSQKVFRYENDLLVSKNVWHEAYAYPNQLIIKFSDFNSGEGILFKDDTLYVFKENKVANQQKRIHDLIILGFDVYMQSAELSFSKLTELGYDLSKMHVSKFDNREVYCVGTADENEKANAFYIDKEHLYFVKNIKYEGEDYAETTFSDYTEIDDKTVATTVEFFRNGSLIMREEYFDIQFPEKFDDAIFEVSNFESAIW